MADLTRFFGQFCTIYFYITFSKKGTQAFISYCMGCFSTRNLQQDIYFIQGVQKICISFHTECTEPKDKFLVNPKKWKVFFYED